MKKIPNKKKLNSSSRKTAMLITELLEGTPTKMSTPTTSKQKVMLKMMPPAETKTTRVKPRRLWTARS